MHCHPQTDSQLISGARHTECFTLGWRPAQLYIRLSIIPLSHQSTYVKSGMIRHYVVAFDCLHFALLDTRELNSNEELCFAQVAAVNNIVLMIKNIFLFSCPDFLQY